MSYTLYHEKSYVYMTEKKMYFWLGRSRHISGLLGFIDLGSWRGAKIITRMSMKICVFCAWVGILIAPRGEPLMPYFIVVALQPSQRQIWENFLDFCYKTHSSISISLIWQNRFTHSCSRFSWLNQGLSVLSALFFFFFKFGFYSIA